MELFIGQTFLKGVETIRVTDFDAKYVSYISYGGPLGQISGLCGRAAFARMVANGAAVPPQESL